MGAVARRHVRATAWPRSAPPARPRHLSDNPHRHVESGRPPITRPEHAYHALEIMLAAQAAGADGVARRIESDFSAPVYEAPAELAAAHAVHDPRTADDL